MAGIPEDAELIKDMACSVGLVLIGFAQFEFVLNSTIADIYENGGRDVVNGEIPLSLKPRLRFMRDATKKIAALQSFRAQVATMMDSAWNIAQVRDDIAHGYISDYEAAGHVLTFAKLRPERPHNTAAVATLRKISMPTLLRVGEEAVALTGQMHPLREGILKALTS